MSPTDAGVAFERQLRKIRLWRRAALWLFVGFIPWGVLVLVLFPDALSLGLLVAWGMVWLVCLVAWGCSVCPRCGHWFFVRIPFWRGRPFGDACVNCDLPL